MDDDPSGLLGAGVRVLYIENDVTAARLFQLTLEPYGYAVEIARDCLTGMALAEQRTYDLIALDQTMPGIDCLEILRVLRERGNATPVIVITSQNNADFALEAVRAGAYDYLVKGSNGAYLLLLPQIIQRVLDRRRLELEGQKTIEELHVQNRNLALLYNASQIFSSTLDVHTITNHLVKSICEFTATKGSSVWLWDTEYPDHLRCRAIYPEQDTAKLAELVLTPGEGIAGWVAQTGRTVSTANAPDDPRFAPLGDERLDFHVECLMAVPMRAQDKVIGVLELLNSAKGYFSDSDAVMAETLASSAAIAIENARLFESLRERTDELEARNEELDAFAHTVAHDLKTPVSLVLGFADMIRDGLGSFTTEETVLYLDHIIDNSTRMSHIIESILLLAVTRDPRDVELEAVDMGAVMDEVLTRLEFTLRQSEAVINVPTEWPTVYGYAPWLEEVWYNYLVNGIKYGGTPPVLNLGFDELEDDYVRFWVVDNGSGIKKEPLQLFQPGRRGPGGAARGGYGLGLSIVKRIVERLNGAVGAEGVPGNGSRFYFTLPCVPPPLPPADSDRA